MIELSNSASAQQDASQEGMRRAVFAGAAVIACVLFFAILYPDASLGALRVWQVSPTFNHCFLILPMTLFLIWHRRNALVGVVPAPDLRAAAAVVVLALVWLGASEAGVLEAQQFVVVSMIEATLLAAAGVVLYRKLAAPFLYLYFLVPSGAWLVPALQAFTAQFSVAGLHLVGIPVFSNGAVIEIPAGTFAIAEACAGLRFLVAAVAFGVFFSVITYRSWWRRAAFVALSVIIPVLANGLRALGLIAAAQWIGNPAAALADHIIYGWVFFSAVLVTLALLGQTFSDRFENDAAKLASARPLAGGRWRLSGRIGVATAACAFAAFCAPLAADVLDAPGHVAVSAAPPKVAQPWRESDSTPGWMPVVAEPTRFFLQSFVRGPDRVDRFIAIYAGHGRGNHAVRLNNQDADQRIWTFDHAGQENLTVGHRVVRVRESVWIRGSQKRFVWSFYAIGGRTAVDVWTAKWDQLRAYLTGSKCLSAYVALSTRAADAAVAARSAGDLLAASQDLNTYLCSPTRARAQ